MDAKQNNYNTPADGDCKSATPLVSTGQYKIKGGYWRRYELVTSTLTHYLKSSPKIQVRQLGGRYLYKGKQNIDLEVRPEQKLRAIWQSNIQLNNNFLRGF